jgi:hypothetical protein
LLLLAKAGLHQRARLSPLIVVTGSVVPPQALVRVG